MLRVKGSCMITTGQRSMRVMLVTIMMLMQSACDSGDDNDRDDHLACRGCEGRETRILLVYPHPELGRAIITITDSSGHKVSAVADRTGRVILGADNELDQFTEPMIIKAVSQDKTRREYEYVDAFPCCSPADIYVSRWTTLAVVLAVKGSPANAASHPAMNQANYDLALEVIYANLGVYFNAESGGFDFNDWILNYYPDDSPNHDISIDYGFAKPFNEAISVKVDGVDVPFDIDIDTSLIFNQ